ncbi:hypothetical protein MTR_7g109070 [Medicago truncatula]|uniref:Uncharacterized protein n=1 Tax=Medicago truncatula TaxID=3880 RepID=G7KSP7_MEDTR|nr:hypothetical protein MTR_7g109070 [Medicago truncatula]
MTLPNSIAKLEHLRVANLSYNRKIKIPPQSIGKLISLQVLSLCGCLNLQTIGDGGRGRWWSVMKGGE